MAEIGPGDVMPVAAGASLIVALAFAAVFHRGRVAFTALVGLWVHVAFGGAAAFGLAAPSGQLAEAALIFAPWNLLLVLVLVETPLVSLRGLLVIVLLAVQTGIGLFLPPELWDRIWALERVPAAWMAPVVGDHLPGQVPGAGFWVGVTGAVLAAWAFWRRRNPVAIGLGAALLASALMPWVVYRGGGPWSLLLVVGVILLLSAGYASYRMAFLDALTGLPGRRMLEERLGRLGRRYALAMVDVDHFKQFNDTHGHDVGDQVLKMVASLMRRHFGRSAYRYGGEEFTLIFAGRAAKRAEDRCEAFRAAVAERELILRGRDRPTKKPAARKGRGGAKGQGRIGVTVSIGLAERNGDHRVAEAVIKAADKALYTAKAAGRDQVFVAGRMPPRRRKAQ